jgi:hypothetical protein
MDRARHVALVPAAVEVVAARLASDDIPTAPDWRTPPHWWDDDDPAATSCFVLLLDALNFSFWGTPRWRVAFDGGLLDGYWALAACLRLAIERGTPLTDPTYLARDACAADLLRGENEVIVPLLAERQAALREVGRGLLEACAGRFMACLEAAEWSAPAIVQRVAAGFPSFRDVASYDGRPVPFYKRAQILVSDLHGALGRQRVRDLPSLTMFADYKVPQVLRELGVLAYSNELEAVLRSGELIAYGDPREVEIRAASVQAVEKLGAALARRDRVVPSYQIDWRLWTLGQELEMTLPYHRTRSVFY